MSAESAIIPVGRIEESILLVRGQRVILDSDLAKLYGVSTRQLNQQIKRNADRFPSDFMLQLTWEEAAPLRSQNVILESRHNTTSGAGISKRGKHSKYRPFAFTEHGAIMAATVLNSPQAVKVSVFVVRAFVKLREMLATHHELAQKLAELERKLEKHDGQIIALIEAIRQLMAPPPEAKRKPIGFAGEMNGVAGKLKAKSVKLVRRGR